MADSTHSNGFKPLQRFFRLLSVDKKEITQIYIYAIVNGLVVLSLPLGIQAIINFITGGLISTSWIVLVAFVIAGLIFSGTLQVAQLAITERLQQRIFARASFEFAYRIPRIRMESVDRYYVPELVNRFFDTLSVQKGLSKILIDFSSATLQVLFGLILLSFYHPLFIAFGLLLVAIVYIILRATGPKGMATSYQESNHKYEVAHWLEEVARLMGTFKLAGESDFTLQRTDGLVKNYIEARKKHFRVLVIQYFNMIGFKVLVAAGLLIMGSLLVIDQQINLGQFVAAEIIIILVLSSVEKLILSMETVYDVLTALEKMGYVTDLPLESQGSMDFRQVDTGKGMEISVDNLTFRYPDAIGATLRNISLRIGSGDRVCLAGFAGSGKSTLIQLIAGLYQNFEGNISYNGIPIGNLKLDSLRELMGDSLHQEKIFKGTLLENITLGRPNIGLAEIQEAIERARLSDFVQNLRKGFNTELDAGGKNLSESVITKIILARSIASKPRLLLITDHFGVLEPHECEGIMDHLTDPSNLWTLVIVSNHAGIASRCRRIILMKHGEIIEDAPFAGLVHTEVFQHLINP
jgi:ABC-type bacteriocin/lantibiotic exporter with double-glycine peptidase domain